MPGARRLGPAGSGPQARRPLGGRSAVRARGAGGIRTRCPKNPGPRPYQLGRSAKNHLKYCWLQFKTQRRYSRRLALETGCAQTAHRVRALDRELPEPTRGAENIALMCSAGAAADDALRYSWRETKRASSRTLQYTSNFLPDGAHAALPGIVGAPSPRTTAAQPHALGVSALQTFKSGPDI